MGIEESGFTQKNGKGILLPRCCLCNEVPEGGICGVVKLKKGFICKRCEWEIINMQVGSGKYEEMLKKIKRLLR